MHVRLSARLHSSSACSEMAFAPQQNVSLEEPGNTIDCLSHYRPGDSSERSVMAIHDRLGRL